jgi:hypothetical protein
MRAKLPVIIGIVAVIIIGITFAVTIPTNYAGQFKYDPYCATQFWTDITFQPDQRYVKSVIIEQLREKIGWNIQSEQIRFYAEDEFVVTIPGNWKNDSVVVLTVKDALEKVNGIIMVKETPVLCA